MNDLLVSIGLDNWRPVLAALALPPASLIVLALFGGLLIGRRRLLGWLMLLVACLGLWFTATGFAAQALRLWLLPPMRALSTGEIADLKKAPKAAVVVLGGGRVPLAPEYGVSDLAPLGLERLRYGIWLARTTELPLLFSGGLGHGSEPNGQTEAEIAARVAERDFGRALRWQETESRDTRENALRSVALLRREGIEHIVLVTHDYHMARARDNFQRAIADAGGTAMRLTVAPMGVMVWRPPRPIDFLPTRNGHYHTSLVLHEWLARLIGA